MFDSSAYCANFALKISDGLAVEADVTFRDVTEELSAHGKKSQSMLPETAMCSLVDFCTGFIWDSTTLS